MDEDLVAVENAIAVGLGVERIRATHVDLFAVVETVVVRVGIEGIRAMEVDLRPIRQTVTVRVGEGRIREVELHLVAVAKAIGVGVDARLHEGARESGREAWQVDGGGISPAVDRSGGADGARDVQPRREVHVGSRAQHGRLPVGVAAPALHRPVGLQPAGVVVAGGQEEEGTYLLFGRLSPIVEAPAFGGAVEPQATGVARSGGELSEGARAKRRGLSVHVGAPALCMGVGSQPARVVPAGHDRRVRTHPLARCLAEVVAAPAGHATLEAQPAGVDVAGGQGDVRPFAERRRLAVVLPGEGLAPALRISVHAQPAAVEVARGEIGEVAALFGGSLPHRVPAPAGGFSAGHERAGVPHARRQRAGGCQQTRWARAVHVDLLAVAQAIAVGVRIRRVGVVDEDFGSVGEAVAIGVRVGRVCAVDRSLFGIRQAVAVAIGTERVVGRIERVGAGKHFLTVRHAAPVGVRRVGIGSERQLLDQGEAIPVVVRGVVHRDIIGGVDRVGAPPDLVAIRDASAIAVEQPGVGAVDQHLVAVRQSVVVAVCLVGIGEVNPLFFGVGETIAIGVGGVGDHHVVAGIPGVQAGGQLLSVGCAPSVRVRLGRVGLRVGIEQQDPVRAEQLSEIVEAIAVGVGLRGAGSDDQLGAV